MNLRQIFGLVLMSEIDPLSTGMLTRSEIFEYVVCPYWANDGGRARLAMPDEEDAEDNSCGTRKRRIPWAHD